MKQNIVLDYSEAKKKEEIIPVVHRYGRHNGRRLYLTTSKKLVNTADVWRMIGEGRVLIYDHHKKDVHRNITATFSLKAMCAHLISLFNEPSNKFLFSRLPDGSYLNDPIKHYKMQEEFKNFFEMLYKKYNNEDLK